MSSVLGAVAGIALTAMLLLLLILQAAAVCGLILYMGWGWLYLLIPTFPAPSLKYLLTGGKFYGHLRTHRG